MENLRERITDLLIKEGLLTSQQLEELALRQQKEGVKFSSILVEKKFLKKELLSEFISINLKLNRIDAAQIAELKITPDLLGLISHQIAHQYHIMPLVQKERGLALGIDDPLTLLDLNEIKELEEYNINPVIVPEPELLKLIENNYLKAQGQTESKPQTLEEILGGIAEISGRTTEDINLSELAHITQEVPIIKATNLILEKAVESKASDILIEPLEALTRIRFRIDGILHQIDTLPKSFHTFIISRIKVLSNLDIAEHRLPQDGQFKIKSKSREVDFRVSVFPSTNGEKVAIRLLDKSLGLLDIDKLGIREESVERLKKAAVMPYGMILLCGPTGSGKTTTLYSLLKYIHTPEKNIVTVEDPVEYQLKGINQVSVNPKVGLLFNRCLRSILRQDPNIIMIGEIRDFETVDIAIKAALTGHLVLSTLHTTAAAGSIVRLVDMGVQPFLINASLICIIAQRLARRICIRCKEKVPEQPYFRGRGCKECLNTGYSGRVLIPEILYMSPEIKEAVLSETLDEIRIKKISRSQGMKTLREEGDALAQQGIITEEEVLRVTPAD
ncbi:MAG: hypothetical protein A2984_01925 [Omnitrophica WOR_2 bacterium RIFCSPLOWO2_01_FULL_41_12]|nr:MAG: hypothetical protein A2984_01925 [Omnitrophica WOR_2 bacterium RIFCSPLOWO2_01_FULL_41_12]